MNLIEVKVNIDINSSEQLQCLNDFLSSLRKHSNEPVNVAGKTTTVTKNEPAKTVEKVGLREEAQNYSYKDESGVTLSDLSKLISAKVKNNREAIKAELTRLGADKAGNLDVDKYQEFSDFLEAL